MVGKRTRAAGNAAILTVFALCLSLTGEAQAQITVAGSTGANGSYTTLADAFAAINANGTQGGNNIAISVVGDTTETVSAVLNQPATSSWTSLTISPSGGNRTISGAIAGHLIDLDGADDVTINGLNSGGNSLTIDNTLPDSASTTIRFYNDATNNTVTNCTIKGAGTSTTAGTLFFDVATVGNTGNVISNNKITSSGANLPTNAIHSTGTTSSILNSGTISANEISDYFNSTVNSSGINLAFGNGAWTITNNKLFQTATRLITAASITHSGILISSGEGYTISGNVVGFANAGGTGTTKIIGNSEDLVGFPDSYTPSGTPLLDGFRPITCAFNAAGTVSEIQGNTVAGIALYSTAAVNGVIAILVTAGNANITGNTVGATSGGGGGSPASIYMGVGGTGSGNSVVGIFASSLDTVSIQNNTIGSIDVSGNSATNAGGFTGIASSGVGGIRTISNNTIGNSTTRNIRVGYTTTTGLAGGPLTNAGILTSTTTATAGTITGITNSATGAPLNIDSNTIRNVASSVSHTGTTSSFAGIFNSGAVPGIVNLTNNRLGTSTEKCATYLGTTTGQINGIINTSTGGTIDTTLNLNNNILQGFDLLSSGQVTAMSNQSSGIGAGINIMNNQIGTATQASYTFNGAQASTVIGYFNTNGAPTTMLNITGNDIRGVVNVVPATAGTLLCISNQGYTGSMNISNNTFTNLSSNTAGTTGTTFIQSIIAAAPDTTKTVNNNSIVGTYTKNGGSGAITFFSYNQAGLASETVTATGNNFSNINLTGTTGVVNGFRCADTVATGSRKTVTNNTFSNITGGTGAMTILNVAGSDNTFDGNNVSGNDIRNVTNGNTVTGITSGLGNQNFFKNRVCGLTANGAAAICNGMTISGGTTQNVLNNLIGNLSAPSTSNTNAVRGINLTSTAVSSSLNVSYNTVRLNTSSTGADFGTSGIFHTANATATTAELTLRNNAIVNLSTPNGAGLTVAFRRSGTDLANYNVASNNNDFYAGTPDSSHLIYHDGTDPYQTLAAYQALVAPRDSASITANPTFLSTTCGSADFLHVDPLDASLDGLGTPIAGITDDVDGDVRNATTPDIGADEYTVVAGCVCDKNIDGIGADGDAADLAMFIDAVLGNPVPPAALTRSDANCDTFVNGLDVQAFVPCFLAP